MYYDCDDCISLLHTCRPKGENVDVKALGDYDSGKEIVFT